VLEIQLLEEAFYDLVLGSVFATQLIRGVVARLPAMQKRRSAE
jgi:hypothetical protein